MSYYIVLVVDNECVWFNYIVSSIILVSDNEY